MVQRNDGTILSHLETTFYYSDYVVVFGSFYFIYTLVYIQSLFLSSIAK